MCESVCALSVGGVNAWCYFQWHWPHATVALNRFTPLCVSDPLDRMREYDSFSAQSFAESSRAIQNASVTNPNPNANANADFGDKDTPTPDSGFECRSNADPAPPAHGDAKACAEGDLTPVEQQLVEALKESGRHCADVISCAHPIHNETPTQQYCTAMHTITHRHICVLVIAVS